MCFLGPTNYLKAIAYQRVALDGNEEFSAGRLCLRIQRRSLLTRVVSAVNSIQGNVAAMDPLEGVIPTVDT